MSYKVACVKKYCKVQAGVWILEVQFRHKELNCGAFFEDLLLVN